MPTLEVDLIIGSVIAALIFGAGWQAESWHMQSIHARDLQSQITLANAVRKENDGIAMQFELDNEAARQTQDALLQKWSVENAKPHTACLLDDSAIGLLTTATTQP